MNYLAHIFLSGSDRKLQVGNFIGDFVKGSHHENYLGQIRKGILLHREIDTFTDEHPVFLETVDFLRPAFGRYSGIMADMFYDYLLASDFRKYSSRSLGVFAKNFYLSALMNYRWLPSHVQGFIFHFIGSDRLKQYARLEGLYDSLKIMERHQSSAIQPAKSIYFLKKHETTLRKQFNTFIPDIILFAEQKKAE